MIIAGVVTEPLWGRVGMAGWIPATFFPNFTPGRKPPARDIMGLWEKAWLWGGFLN